MACQRLAPAAVAPQIPSTRSDKTKRRRRRSNERGVRGDDFKVVKRTALQAYLPLLRARMPRASNAPVWPSISARFVRGSVRCPMSARRLALIT